MPTGTKKTFDTNIQRAGYFLDLHKAVHGGAQGAPQNPVRELPRAAVVFAVGALDSFLSDVSAEFIVALLEKDLPSDDVRELLGRVRQDLPTLSLEIALVEGQKERRQRLQEAVADHLHNKVSHHGAKGVSRTIERMGGTPRDIWDRLRSDGFEQPQRKLDAWTEKRHRIVHQGQKAQVHRSHGRRCIELVTAVAAEVDKLAVSRL